jgi:hypothetical protein
MIIIMFVYHYRDYLLDTYKLIDKHEYSNNVIIQ